MSQPTPPPRDFVSSSSMSVHTLPEGTLLRDFEICGLIGEGGFGIVYLADDHSLGRRVAIKEYMPASMASRAHSSSAVVVKSQRHEETFRLGLKSFVNEARLLARFDHPALVKVYRFWEENGTAYMVMPYYQGPTLKGALTALGRTPTETELRNWLRPLLDALSVMHAANCFHRDIAPDNILLTTTGPLLLDFGAARHVIADMTHALTVVLKPGYAPIEQYGEVPSLTQGAWTDLYALASVVYTAISGKAPISAVERLMDDRHVPLAELPQVAGGAFSENFVRAIDAALQVRPRDRPQDVQAFRLLFDGEAAAADVRSPLDFVSTFGSLHESRLAPALSPTHSPGQPPTQPRTEPRTQPRTQPDTQPGLQPPTHAGAPHHERTDPGLAADAETTRRHEASAPLATPPEPVATAPSIDPATAAATPPTPAHVKVARPVPVEPPAAAHAPAAERVALQRAATSPVARTSNSKVPAVAAVATLVVVMAGAGAWYLTRADRGEAQSSAPSPSKEAAPQATAPVASPDPAAAKAADKSIETAGDKATDKATDRAADRAIDKAADKPLESAQPDVATKPAPAEPPPTAAAPVLVPPAAPPAPPPTTSPPPATATRAAPAHREARNPAPDTTARTPERPAAEASPPKNAAQTRAKCSDILQKASLEPLTASEAAFLRRECQ